MEKQSFSSVPSSVDNSEEYITLIIPIISKNIKVEDIFNSEKKQMKKKKLKD